MFNSWDIKKENFPSSDNLNGKIKFVARANLLDS